MNIEVNGNPIQAEEGETILTAVRRAGVDVPTLCHLGDLEPSGACRICVVEVEGKPGLVPSCAFPVADGMKVHTHSSAVLRARKTIVELLLADHPDDCLYCVRNGNCELQNLAEELGVRERRFVGETQRSKQDVSSPSLVRDPDKCILCGRCVRVCEEIQGVAAIDFAERGCNTQVTTAFDDGLNVSSCVNCGQCVMVCPTGALREQSHLKRVQDALVNPNAYLVVQHAPSISVSLAEEFGMKPGTDVNEKMTAALRALGFDSVFETSFGADLTIMEEASELLHRVNHGGTMPMMTSCSPAWIKYVEQFYPEFMDNLSTCKSPQQMLGAIVKSFYARQTGIDPDKIVSIAVMPCTAKKFEAQRPELSHDGRQDVDAVITTRELARLLRMRGINLDEMPPEHADSPLGERSTAGKIFGATGGVMEAAVRTAHYLATGNEMNNLNLQSVRGLEGLKEATVNINGIELNVGVANGLGSAKEILKAMKDGRKNLDFLEVMSCPGGCIGGGGQPLNPSVERLRSRMQRLYSIDRNEKLRTSHSNPSIQRLYRDFLGEPLGETSHELLHTSYRERQDVI